LNDFANGNKKPQHPVGVFRICVLGLTPVEPLTFLVAAFYYSLEHPARYGFMIGS